MEPTNPHTVWSRSYREKHQLAMVGVLLNRDLSNRFNAVLDKEGRSKREVIEAFIRNYIEQDEKNSVKA
jgi:hypothetical protein